MTGSAPRELPPLRADDPDRDACAEVPTHSLHQGAGLFTESRKNCAASCGVRQTGAVVVYEKECTTRSHMHPAKLQRKFF